MSPSNIINRQQPWVPRYALEELGGDLLGLNCECFGFVQRLRDLAWANFGLPTSEEKLMEIGLSFRFSRYKFKKYWNDLKNFFTEKDGRLYFTRDLEHREAALEKSSKLQESGKLGAEIRKQRNGYHRPSVPKVGHGQAILFDGNQQPHPDPDFYNPIEEVTSTATTTEYPQTPMAAEAEVSPPVLVNNGNGNAVTRSLSDEDYQIFIRHCETTQLQIPSRTLCQRIRDKFPDLECFEIMAFLPRLSNQQSPALWAALTAEQLMLESQRSSPGGRKPTAREIQTQEGLAWLEARTK